MRITKSTLTQGPGLFERASKGSIFVEYFLLFIDKWLTIIDFQNYYSAYSLNLLKVFIAPHFLSTVTYHRDIMTEKN